MSQAFRWTVAGLVIGFLLSLGVGVASRNVLFGVTPTDGPTYFGVFAVLALASLLACYFPARRASRIDPIRILRQD